MKEYYEDLWGRLPEALEPPDFAIRADFLMSAVSREDRVLDVGCGDGVFTEVLTGTARSVVAADVAEAALARVQARGIPAQTVLVPFDGPLPLEDNSFTVVWASEVIEHVADTATFLSEIRRVLVPRGVLLVTTPNHSRLALALGGIERFSPPLGDHLHLYDRAALSGVLEEFGFGEVSVSAAAGLPIRRRLLLARARR